MFSGCTSLVEAPQLPAQYMAQGCYMNMFEGCTSLTQAPELPSTNLAQDCYRGMFYWCTSLTQAPDLPATTLAPYCYYAMFSHCSSLNSIKVSFTVDFNYYYASTWWWVENVAPTGTFYYNGTDRRRGYEYIPEGWDVVAIDKRYKHLKMVVTKKSYGTALQIGKIDFVDDNGNRYYYPSGTTTSVENLTPYEGEGSNNLIDGSTDTKLCANIDAMPCSITIDLGGDGILLGNYPKYQWWTANDSVA